MTLKLMNRVCAPAVHLAHELQARTEAQTKAG